MNSIDSKIPRRTECGDHIHDCPQLAEMLDDLREENARLRAEVEQYRAEGMVPGGAWAYDLERLKTAEAKLARLEYLHQTLLDTLAPSRSPWIQHVVRNSKAAWENWAAKGE